MVVQDETKWTAAAPCPGCGKNGWCQAHEDGLVMCRRGAPVGKPGEWKSREDRHGVPYHLFTPVEKRRATFVAPARPPKKASPKRMAVIYGDLLKRTALSDKHRNALIKRGMTDEVIDRNHFRSVPSRSECGELMIRLYREYGAEFLSVPGFYLRKGRPALAAGPGWMLPLWDVEGHLSTIRVRRDGLGKGPKYYYLSSRKHGGPGAAPQARLSWPGRHPRTGDRSDLVRITEGECKAIICAEYTNVPTISVPGVEVWRLALPWMEKLEARRVLLAWDSDFRTNPAVARSLLEARRVLKKLGYQTDIEVWGSDE